MKIKHLILAFGGASLLAACNLDEYPYGFYSEDNFYKTEADAESAVNYIYDAINYIEYSRSIVFLGDMNTDDMEPKGDAAAANKELDGWKINNFKTNTTLGNFYKYSYITINRANAVIKKVPGMNIDEGRRNRFLGEAYFMRAYSYFNLARNFGCVPVHTTPVETLEDTAVPAAESLDAMWKLVIEDFKTAGTLLPFFAAPETGRADRAAAYGMLAKAYLYIASAKEHGVPQYAAMSHDVDEYYAEAVKYAGLVVDNPEQTVFRFDDNLLDIYDVERPAGPEHIFIMSMDRTGESEGQYSKISKMYLPYVSGATIYLKQGDSDQMVPTHPRRLGRVPDRAVVLRCVRLGRPPSRLADRRQGVRRRGQCGGFDGRRQTELPVLPQIHRPEFLGRQNLHASLPAPLFGRRIDLCRSRRTYGQGV